MHAEERISHPIGAAVVCAETGKTFTVAPDGCSVNYAVSNAGETLSDEGVDTRERRDLSHRAGPFVCYLSSSGQRITGWKGNVLGTVVQSSVSRTGWHGSTLTHVSVRDVHGGMWHGKGAGPGMVIRLRPCKDAARPRGPVARIPASHPVRPIRASNPTPGRMTCGHCRLSWDDSIITGMTPTPGGRCPFEYFHR